MTQQLYSGRLNTNAIINHPIQLLVNFLVYTRSENYLNFCTKYLNYIFSARFRDNRSIFNTPNPRLMNVSLLRDSKILHQERRGSKGSLNRGPSRQPSMVSLRANSPNSQGITFRLNIHDLTYYQMLL